MLWINWRDSVPAEVRQAAEPIIDKWKHRLPHWLLEVCVYFTGNDGNNCSITTEYEYRRAALFIHLGWLHGTERDREEDLVHEFAHVFLARPKATIDSLIDRLLEKDPVFQSWARDEIRRAVEGTVCDITHIILHRE